MQMIHLYKIIFLDLIFYYQKNFLHKHHHLKMYIYQSRVLNYLETHLHIIHPWQRNNIYHIHFSNRFSIYHHRHFHLDSNKLLGHFSPHSLIHQRIFLHLQKCKLQTQIINRIPSHLNKCLYFCRNKSLYHGVTCLQFLHYIHQPLKQLNFVFSPSTFHLCRKYRYLKNPRLFFNFLIIFMISITRSPLAFFLYLINLFEFFIINPL